MSVLANQLPLEQAYNQTRQVLEDIVQYMKTEETSLMTHSKLERELEKKGRELMRILLQEHLDNRSPGDCKTPVIDSNGMNRSRSRPHERKLETVFGTVSVERTGYGREGAESLHPMDAELNLPNERYSLELRRRVAIEAAKNSFDETLESIAKTTGGHIPKRQVEELTKRAAQDFDAFYKTRQCKPSGEVATGSVMVITTDGKGVVMHEQDLREQTRKAAAKRKHKMGKRLSKGEKKNSKRMATVAAVYTTDTFYRTPKDLVPETSSTLNKEKGPVQSKNVSGQVLRKPPSRSLEMPFPKHAIATQTMRKIGLLWSTVTIAKSVFCKK